MSHIVKEPLFHFLLIGIGLFVIYGFIGNDDEGPVSDREIVVSAAKLQQLAAIFAKTWQRPPTKPELKGLIDDFVLEEIYYREAVAMGIDQNDTIIRRRMRQKMEFLTEDIAAQAEPSDEELKAYLAENEKDFQKDPAYTFRQIYFNPKDHGDDPVAFAKTRADELRAGAEVEGDRTLLPAAFEDATRREIDGTFGTGFADQLEGIEIGQWSDPIRSGMGLHLVRIESRTPGALPDFEKIRPQLEREWSHRNRLEMRKRFNEELLKKYEVVIEAGRTRGGIGNRERGMKRGFFLFLLVLAAAAPILPAHEMRPAYLEIRQTGDETFDMLWKVPGRGPQQRLALYVRLPGDCEILEEAQTSYAQAAFIERSSVRRPGGLTGIEITIDGLTETLTDVLARVERSDGTVQIARLTPTSPVFAIEASPSPFEVAKTYTWLGIEHIWIGIDHLLFIGCLLFVAGTWKRILITITGFTIAHSITLALAALDLVRLPIAPVEAVIALSIVFLAVEIARGNEQSLTYRYPIAVSSSFGLLHGFGFAAVLQEIGLPQKDLVVALLFFNVGVEIGQVIFAAVLLILVQAGLWLWRRQTELNLRSAPARRAAVLASYIIGPIATYWVIERMMP